MKTKYVTDTMAIVIRLEKRKLPAKVKQLFEKAEHGEMEIYIPAIVFAELGYLSEKGKIDISLDNVKDYCNKYPSIKEKETTLNTIINTFQISDIPELHDRIIAGTALELNHPIITNDTVIANSRFVTTIWG